jgi:hypothetical protein
MNKGDMKTMTIPAKAKTRLTQGLKKFQPILKKAKSADINESDTVTIIADMLSDIFGYDKYTEITSEYAIKKTFCDLAIKMQDKIALLIECKAIGLTLKDDFVRQATNYAADSGVEWVILTNGIQWNIYKVLFTKPIEKELVYEFDITELNSKKDSDLELIYSICKESMGNKTKNNLEELYVQKQVINKFIIGQMILSDPMIDQLRKQLRKLSSELKPDTEIIKSILINDVLKREVQDGDQAADAKKKIQKMEKSQATKKTS